ncbi:heme-binding protein, partial [Escherichia coli]|uniref:heme-binding protein n=1 Tax=Escherichia coli TaxID=562 RepID=UPI00202536D0
MKTKVILSQQMASAIIAAGQEEAQKNNWSVSIAVADDGGHLLALSRMDDCAPIAAYISQEKARTAALGRRETKGYEEMVNNGRTAFATAPLLTALEGWVPGVGGGASVVAGGGSGFAGGAGVAGGGGGGG